MLQFAKKQAYREFAASSLRLSLCSIIYKAGLLTPKFHLKKLRLELGTPISRNTLNNLLGIYHIA
jgi:hypothetical protein